MKYSVSLNNDINSLKKFRIILFTGIVKVLVKGIN